MQRKELAEELIAAKTAAERARLLTANKKLADEKLARQIKDICYAAWTSTPTQAQKAANALKSLYKFNPRKDIQALLLWVSGISKITKGKLEPAIDDLDKAADIFLELDRGHESAQTRVARLIALALLGRYQEAVKTGEKALKILEKYGDDLTAGKVEKNLGNIVSRQELHLKAEKYYLSARKRFVRTKEKSEQIMAENGLAITYTQLNDFEKAEKFFKDALKNARGANMLLTAAEIEASMGNLALYRGRYDEALRCLELSRRKYETLNMPHQIAVAELEIADIYRELNLTPEAFDIYRDVSGKFRKLKLQGEEARARANFGRTASFLNETALARTELKRSARLYERERNKTGAAEVKLEEAKLEIGQDNFKKALEILGEAETLLSGSESFRHKLTLKLLKADAFGRDGHPAKSEKLLLEAFDEANRQEQPNIALASLNLLGKLARGSGDSAKAKKYFKKAVGLIEKLRAPLAAEEFRMAFLADKTEPFENMAAICLAENKLSEAFFYIQQARSRTLAESLKDRIPHFSRSKIPSELAERAARLREELNWFYSRVDRAEGEESVKLHKEAKRREKELAAMTRQIESTGEKGALKKGRAIDTALLQKQLGGKDLLIEFVHFDGVFSAFILDDRDIRYVKDLATEEEIRELLEGLRFQFGALRYGAKIPERFMAELKTRADLYLQKLYQKLLKPLENYLGERQLVIVPVGTLYYVPFHALHDGEKYLIENREVRYAPSAAVWQVLQQKNRQKNRNKKLKTMLMGFADEKIPLVDREIKELKKIFPGAKSFTGEKATYAAFTRNAPAYDLLHLACHGQFRPENPMFSSLHLADGWVTVRDICSQKLKAGLVTLSACETGLNKIFAGDEVMARGFLSAGADSLILSLWTVNDTATSELMTAFYKSLQRGQSFAASIRIAQNDFIKRGEHPYFWSPFALIGR
jgi:tetratricopeptide (TPR) repeat protein